MGRRQLEDAAWFSHYQAGQVYAGSQPVFVLSRSSGHEGASMWSYSGITEDKLDLFLQNPICSPFPLLPSHPGHVAMEEKELLPWTRPTWRLGAWFIQALMSRSYSRPLVLFSDFALWFTASVEVSCNSPSCLLYSSAEEHHSYGLWYPLANFCIKF